MESCQRHKQGERGKGQLYRGSSLPGDLTTTVTTIATNSSSSLFRVEAQRTAIKIQVLSWRES